MFAVGQAVTVKPKSGRLPEPLPPIPGVVTAVVDQQMKGGGVLTIVYVRTSAGFVHATHTEVEAA